MVTSLDASSDGAACWVATDTYTGAAYQTELAPIDFGIAATVDGTYYGADPFGVFTFDDTDTGGSQSWNTAISTCTDGKRLSGASVLRAIYTIDSTTPTGFTADSYWSSFESPSSPSSAYRSDLTNGGVGRASKGGGRYVRCVQ